MSRSTDHDEDEGEYIDAEEYLQHALMNETKAYFDRGRRFANVDVAQLNEKWVVIFKAYFADHNRQQGPGYEHGSRAAIRGRKES
jgi:hypothetical protein